MNIDDEELIKKKIIKKKKNKKALSFLGSIFTFLFLDFLSQVLIPLAILIVMIYFYLK